MTVSMSPMVLLTIGVFLGGISVYLTFLPSPRTAWSSAECPPAVPCQERVCEPCSRAVCPACPANSPSAKSNPSSAASSPNNHQQASATMSGAVTRNFTLFPDVPRPYTCIPGAASVKVALRQRWITADPQPVTYTMYLHPAKEDIYVSATIYQNDGNNMFEMDLKADLYRFLRGTDNSYDRPVDPILLDVGANIGTHSLFFAAIGIRTHAFEPMPKNLNLIRCSAAANPNMTLTYTANGFGLSDKTSDKSCMRVDWNNQGNAFVETGDDCTVGGIQLRRLDDYWRQVLNSEHVFAMKMDAQGFEGFVIRGAAEMFRTKPPVVIFTEFSPFRYRSYGMVPRQILLDLIDYGYTIKWNNKIVAKGSELMAKLCDLGDYMEENLVLLNEPLLHKLRTRQIKF